MDENTGHNLPSFALDRDLDAMFGVVTTIQDNVVRRRFDRAVGDVMGDISRDLAFRIERLHPASRPEP